ncbi:MAG: hypothetical protein ACYS6W_01580 [Planctomycetota bacterium]|jgi:hypothetical protein
MNDIPSQYGLRQFGPSGLPYMPGAEALENLMRDFNQVPLEYETTPTGETIVSRNMLKPYGPVDLNPPFQNYFRSSSNPSWGMDQPWLGMRWILPEGAMTGPKFIDRTPPTSDAARMSGFNMGVGNVGQNTTTLNPQTHWPESMFKVPLRDPSGNAFGDPYLPPEPIFGSVVDFSRNRYNLNNAQPGQWSQQYGPIQGGVPGHGQNPMIPPTQSTNLGDRMNQLMLNYQARNLMGKMT